MRRLGGSLQTRLLLGLLAALSVVWGATAVVSALHVRHELDELLDGHLAQAAALLVAQQSHGIEEDRDALDAPQLHRYAPRAAFQVWHAGRLALRSANAPDTPMVAPAELSLSAPAPRPAERRRSEDRPRPQERRDRDEADHARGPDRAAVPAPGYRVGFHSVQVGRQTWRVFAAQGAEQDVQVFVGEQVASRTEILRAVLSGSLVPLALALPLLGLAILWVVRGGLAPLHRLSRLLAARDAQTLSPLQLPDAPAEMAPLLDALNRLFQRIADMMVAERRFTADAAHELRTPIAAIRAQAQVALAETDEQARAHALRATLAGCDRAARLVDQMLMLARLEAGEAPALAAVELGAVARRVAAELAPQAIGRRQVLGLDAETPAVVHGNETLLAVLVRNLVDNALRYSLDGAEVQLRVAASPAGVTLQVDDSGPGLPEADRARLGERFFRVLGSGQTGSGLGWSIVRRIAAAHGASVAVEPSAALGGLAVSVRWPPAPPAAPAA